MIIYSPLIGDSGCMRFLTVSATHLVVSSKSSGPLISAIKKKRIRYSLSIKKGANLANAISDSFSATTPFDTRDFESRLVPPV